MTTPSAFGGNPQSAARWFAQDPAWWNDHYVGAAHEIAEFLGGDGIQLSDARVVDLGCGDGSISAGLANLGCVSVVGVDLEPVDRTFLDEAARRNGVSSLPNNLRFLQCTEVDLPLETGSADVVTAWSVFEHVADIPTLLGEVRRVLRLDGALFLQIWPLWHSEHGAHQWAWLDTTFQHLALPADELEAQVRVAAGDAVLGTSFVELFRSCNGLSIDQLQEGLVAAGFFIAKVQLESKPFHVPAELQHVPLSLLGIGGIKLIAIRH